MTAGGAGLSGAGQCRNVCILKLSHFRGSLQEICETEPLGETKVRIVSYGIGREPRMRIREGAHNRLLGNHFEPEIRFEEMRFYSPLTAQSDLLEPRF
jgi:hypothetical protein